MHLLLVYICKGKEDTFSLTFCGRVTQIQKSEQIIIKPNESPQVIALVEPPPRTRNGTSVTEPSWLPLLILFPSVLPKGNHVLDL